MKNAISFALALAIAIPALFGNFWLFAVTGFFAETAVEPLLGWLLNSVAPG